MQRSLLHIAILLLTSTAVLSCSKAHDTETLESDSALEGNKVLISGIVSDEDGNTLEGISIQLFEFLNSNEEVPVNSIKTYTDKLGYFSLYADGDSQPMICHVIAFDPSGSYKSQTRIILVNWAGPTYDNDARMFVVNDCNFVMTK